MKKQRNMAVAALALIDETFGAEADNKAPSSEQASDTPTAGDISVEISTEAHLAGGREGIKTALVLSGGGSRGAYECGAWQAVVELGIRIDMVVGVSVGALNGAMVAQGDQPLTSELWRSIETDKVFDVPADAQLVDYAQEFFKQGGATSKGLQRTAKKYINEDIIRKSDVDFGLLTVETPSMKPHYLWKEDIPEGRLHDYIIASASAFPAVHRYRIDGKDYIDGGYENVIPIHMAWERGADKVIAVYLKAPGKFIPDEIRFRQRDITLIQPNIDLGNFLVFDRGNNRRIMRLGYLDAMRAFGVYDGSYFSFVKRDFDMRTVKGADAAGRIFGLDPLILYRRQAFLGALLSGVVDASVAVDEIAGLKELRLDAIREIAKQVNKKAATVYIARDLKSKGNKSLFSNASYIPRAVRDQVLAAKFLVKCGLI